MAFLLLQIALQTRGDSTAAADRPDFKSGLAGGSVDINHFERLQYKFWHRKAAQLI
jgi:hypothetical protein